MRILRQGNDPKNNLLVGKCCHCECEIECSQNECQWKEDSDGKPGAGGLSYRCPTCSQLIFPKPRNKSVLDNIPITEKKV